MFGSSKDVLLKMDVYSGDCSGSSLMVVCRSAVEVRNGCEKIYSEEECE